MDARSKSTTTGPGCLPLHVHVDESGTTSASSKASSCAMDEDLRAAKLATIDGPEPSLARDLRLHPQTRRWSGPSLTPAPPAPHYAQHTSSGSVDHQARNDEIPIVFSANSAGTFIPSIVDAPAYEDHHFAQLSAEVKQQSKKLVADERAREGGTELRK